MGLSENLKRVSLKINESIGRGKISGKNKFNWAWIQMYEYIRTSYIAHLG